MFEMTWQNHNSAFIGIYLVRVLETLVTVNHSVTGTLSCDGRNWVVTPADGHRAPTVTAKTRKAAIENHAALCAAIILTDPMPAQRTITACPTCGMESCSSRFDCIPA